MERTDGAKRQHGGARLGYHYCCYRLGREHCMVHGLCDCLCSHINPIYLGGEHFIIIITINIIIRSGIVNSIPNGAIFVDTDFIVSGNLLGACKVYEQISQGSARILGHQLIRFRT